MVSTLIAPDIVEYPDSGKVGAQKRRRRADPPEPARADARLLGRRGLRSLAGDDVKEMPVLGRAARVLRVLLFLVEPLEG